MHVPYSWNGYTGAADANSGGVDSSHPPEQYWIPRWISVIDEFKSYESMMSQGEPGQPGAYGWGGTDGGMEMYEIKQGQMSRRVVEVSASGVVLSDKTWQFDGDGVQISGGGLGEEYVYETAYNVIKNANNSGALVPQWALPEPVATPGVFMTELQSVDPIQHLRRELVLMEHRSVGWSAATGADQLSRGLTHFYEYIPRRYWSGDAEVPTGPATDWDYAWIPSVALSAEGVSRGSHYVMSTTPTVHLVENSSSSGSKAYTRQLIYPPSQDEAAPQTYGGMELDSAEIRFLVPTRTLVSAGSLPAPGAVPGMDKAITYSLVQRVVQADVPRAEWKIGSRMTIGVAKQLRPGATEWYWPLEREWYDVEGMMTWAASGLVSNPLEPSDGGLQSLTFTRYLREPTTGRPTHTIMDADGAASVPLKQHAGAPQISPGDILVNPSGWPRICAEPALNYITAYQYLGNDMTDIYFANGRRWARRVVTIIKDEMGAGGGTTLNPLWNAEGFDAADYEVLPALHRSLWFVREYILNDVEAVSDSGGGNQRCNTRMLGEIRDYEGLIASGSPVQVRKVYFARNTTTPCGATPHDFATDLRIEPQSQPRFIEEARVELAIDSTGRLTTASLLEADPDGAMLPVGSKDINDLVDCRREREIDGTITRVTRDKWGQALRTYTGTSDDAWNGATDPTPGTTPDNMVLVGRAGYGLGVHDAWLPVMSRTYNRIPTGGWASDPYQAVTDESVDTDGYATVTGYDWRMRPVRVDSYGESLPNGPRTPSPSARLSTTLTYLDHLDRPIVVVSAGRSATPGVPLTIPPDLDPMLRHNDPPETNPGGVDPCRLSLAELGSLAGALGSALISIEELFYGPDGSQQERRVYDMQAVAAGSGTIPPGAWHSEYTYTGRGGNTVYSSRPEQPVELGVVDGLGRLAKTRSVVTNPGTGGGSGVLLGHELAGTDFVLDADGNVVDTRHLERAGAAGGAGAALNDALNAVRARSVSWFDPKKRLTASAELGTETAVGSNASMPSWDAFVVSSPVYPRLVNAADQHEPRFDCANVGPSGAPTIVHGAELPGARLMVHKFDLLTGRLTHTRNGDGSFTRFEYDRAGRLKTKVENCFGAMALRRTVGYEYQYGRLVAVTAARVADAGAGAPQARTQTTRVRYEADVLAEDDAGGYIDAPVSQSRRLVGKLSLPKQDTGSSASTSEDIVIRYTMSGQAAERIDGRGVVQRYFYDGLGRLTRTVVGKYTGGASASTGEFVAKYPDIAPGDEVAPDRVGLVTYGYDGKGRLWDIVAKVSEDASQVIAQNRFEYDARGNLVSDWQSIGAGIVDGTGSGGNAALVPKTEYAWSYRATAAGSSPSTFHVGYDRLTRMTYPQHAGVASVGYRRVVDFAYGTAGSVGSGGASIDDQISRVTGMTTNQGAIGSGGATAAVAEFGYLGVSRRASLVLGSGIGAVRQSLDTDTSATSVGLEGLDRFGQVKDLHYTTNPANVTNPSQRATLFRGRYTHDLAGNRLSAVLTQAPVASVAYDNKRSQLHTYDALHRLTASRVGVAMVDGATGVVSMTQPATVRSDAWGLDLLGNWSGVGGGGGSGRSASGNLDGFSVAGVSYPVGGNFVNGSSTWMMPGMNADAGSDTSSLVLGHNEQNQITQLGKSFDGATQQQSAIRHDGAGNLIFDGTYCYQYDAWSRLIQVNYGALVAQPNAPPGTLMVVPGLLVKQYAYDGLGRLVRAVSPYPNPQSAGEQRRSERFYYDGVRRIQEVVTDPVQSLAALLAPPGSGSGSSGSSSSSSSSASAQQAAIATVAAEDDVDTDGVSAAAENAQLAGQPVSMGTANASGASGGGGTSTGTVATYLDREYIWGPGDGVGSGVDELFVQFDRARKPWWMLQDGGGDVVAECESPVVSGVQQAARVAAQWTYDAYGSVASADHLYAHSQLRCGHKGLFVDRLDAGVSGGSDGASGNDGPARLVPFGHVIYHNRNRTYNPQFGRFMQADPNASAMTLLEGASFNGRGLSALVGAFDLDSRLSDGANLYQYIGSNPNAGSDPMGLWMWGDWMDTLGTGAQVFGLVRGVLDSHQFVMSEMVDWATDWSRSDDEYTDLRSILVTTMGEVDSAVDEAAGVYAPAIAGIGGSSRALAATMRIVGRGMQGFGKWLSKGPKNVKVYVRYNQQTGKADYVGITNDVVRRTGEHGYARLREVASGLTRNQARAIEQEILRANPHFANAINSIAPTNRFAQLAQQWARQAMSQMSIGLRY